MGCDIHTHFELKIDGKWEYYGPGDFDRDYTLFTRLAGVRDYWDDTERIDDPRGLPDDITMMIKLHVDDWGINGHSHSWVSSEEYVKVIKYMRELRAGNRWSQYNHIWLFGNSFCEFHEDRNEFPECVEDFRMVFWFDN